MLDFLELEETVGRAWHRLVGGTAQLSASIPTRPSRWTRCRARLAVMFRGFGGEPGVADRRRQARKSGHRLGWRQRIGLGEERLDQPGRDPATVFLPAEIAIFPDRDTEPLRSIVWLAAWFATVPVATVEEHDPLRRDLLPLRRARETVAAVLARFPAGRNPLLALSAATASRAQRGHCRRPNRRSRQIVLALLGRRAPRRRRPLVRDDRRHAAARASPCRISALAAVSAVGRLLDPRGRTDAPQATTTPRAARRSRGAGHAQALRARRERGRRRQAHAIPFILNRFEKILAMAEMVNVDRPSDDSEDEDAARPADDLDETHARQPQRQARDQAQIRSRPAAGSRRPDAARQQSRPIRNGTTAAQPICRTIAGCSPARGAGDRARPGRRTKPCAARSGRCGASSRRCGPRHEILRGQTDGARPRSRCGGPRAQRSGAGSGGQRSGPLAMRPAGPRPRRHAAGRRLALHRRVGRRPPGARRRKGSAARSRPWAFRLRRPPQHPHLHLAPARLGASRDRQAFDEPMGAAVERRIARAEAGLLHAHRRGDPPCHGRARRSSPNRKKLLLVLTDGKPNDVDHYEGRFALEDTRKAVHGSAPRGRRRVRRHGRPRGADPISLRCSGAAAMPSSATWRAAGGPAGDLSTALTAIEQSAHRKTARSSTEAISCSGTTALYGAAVRSCPVRRDRHRMPRRRVLTRKPSVVADADMTPLRRV